MRVAILTPGYPSATDLYNWAFVHARAKLYQQYGHEVLVLVLGDARVWTFEGVSVRQGSVSDLLAATVSARTEVLAVHGPYRRLIGAARRFPLPRVVWIHGHEVLWEWSAFLRGRTLAERMVLAAKTPVRLLVQMARVRRFIRESRSIVFVSDWMRRAAERHTAARYPHAIIIPNPVDLDLFKYGWNASCLLHGVTARSLNSRKYGVDLAIRAIASTREADLRVVGGGSLEGSLRALARSINARVSFTGGFVPHGSMPALYRHFGFFLAASRVEAQGVGMCEAMAVGLPVVATRVGGIPEFVNDGAGGFLAPPGNWRALAAAIEGLVSDPVRAARHSEAARRSVEVVCGAPVVTPRELQVLRDSIQ